MIEREAERLRIRGPMTMAVAPALRVEGLAAVAAGGCETFDLSAVEEVDSSALAVLLAWRRAAGRPLRLTGVPAALQSLAGLYRLDELLEDGV